MVKRISRGKRSQLLKDQAIYTELLNTAETSVPRKILPKQKKTTHKTKRENGLENCFKCSILFIDIMISLHFSGDEGYRIRHTQLTFSKAYFHKNGHMMLFYVLIFSGEGRM